MILCKEWKKMKIAKKSPRLLVEGEKRSSMTEKEMKNLEQMTTRFMTNDNPHRHTMNWNMSLLTHYFHAGCFRDSFVHYVMTFMEHSHFKIVAEVS
jgi:hypothetical protein